MAALVSVKRSVLVVLFILTTFHVLPVPTSAFFWDKVQELSRAKKELCKDGTYDHEGKTCCRCPSGERLRRHCTVRADDGKCDPCPDKQYNSHPSFEPTCEPCTSCSHPNANLEEAEPCTSVKDAVCRCKPHHYCSMEPCKICHPCKECGEEGIKETCTSTRDTVCNVKGDEKSTGVGVGIGIALAILIITGLVIFGVYYWKKKNSGQMYLRSSLSGRMPPGPDGSTAGDTEMGLLKDVELSCYIPDIAKVLGWKDMRNIALKSGMLQADIESCRMNHRDDVEEQTVELLQKWEGKMGKNAGTVLVEMLRNANNKLKAEKVMKILNVSSAT